ncbi:MAG: hypothetical protein PHH77_10360 [Victivallaceae bacterium]|nr:hypothetical protein [Victivallaceae bacterium]
MKQAREQGQVMVEFAIILVMCTLFVVALLVLFYYFTEYGERLLDLVGIDCP